jgi:(E)-4-hydroxy-3-methylbut-2-enyl-diphosphate synthase
VSEAGVYSDAIIKSAIGLYPLLKMGIGNTIRISISGSPLQEPVITKKILAHVGLYDKQVNIISCPTCGRLQ